jgi:hypothetical protein
VRAPKKKLPPRPTSLPRIPPSAVVRTFLLAALAILACVWAIVSYVTRPHRTTIVPAPATSASSDDGEVPAPDIVPLD